jgi:DNA-binding NarL/FixJ family response regulator
MSTPRTLDIPPTDGEAELVLGIIAEDASMHDRLVGALDCAGIEFRAQACTAEQLAASAPEVDVAILYAGVTGTAELLDAVRRARNALPSSVALVAVWPERVASDSRRALRAGADGLVSENDLDRTLAPTLHAVRSGVICVPRPMRARLESESLSMREKQVLSMLVMGFTNAEIAAKMFLAESTVKSHLSSAYTKLGVRSRKDAATMILDPVAGLGPGILTINAA